ncbi:MULTISPECIES: hypothetical protein [unclassified Microcoleus]|uniref:hypothetical protein n=1 Tax=unclassified Microcoleus TaxID=2642155 RepID=UPI002FD4DEA1
MKLTADTQVTEFSLSLDLQEIQLLMLALNWAVDKSEEKQGAQTTPLKALERTLRIEYHELLEQHNLLEQLKERISDDATSREDLKKFIPPDSHPTS